MQPHAPQPLPPTCADVARAITSSALMHSGQICMSTERVIVSRKVAPALTKALTVLRISN
ncbi:hypothetical protein OBBRIDRAFT_840357 [Obba rivulosa]|uniref:Aldehyde dehydrogenase domain-containing protein n=1 Tax=Obba rivulosa TaxID=1052685 RepID=A0A8E2DFB3_9APHY|nr:hypothetical protein OBBRIDRAFT_840357 [Obba rivulosa]